MVKKIVLICFVTSILNILNAQTEIKTTAENTNYENTSRYSEVIDFINKLKKTSKYIRSETIAVTEEGREIPLLIIANPMPKLPVDLLNDKRIVVYLQGNIHAGEVEGKEALLMFARDLVSKKENRLLKDVVFLICPIFNADGNEKISINNRTNQNGPKNGVGVRYNGGYLDLNRDALKIESPEMAGLISNVLNKWDPAVIVDCHTTNGIFRQEPVTFNWMMNPNGNRKLINYMRDKMMPVVSKTLLEKYKVENCFYGEFEDLGHPENGYVSYAHEPRYLVNYVGIRNRFGILNENYVHADFKTRVEGCYSLVYSILEYVVQNKNEIKEMLHEADLTSLNRWSTSSTIDSFSFDYKVLPIPSEITIKVFEVEKDTDQQNYLGYKPTPIKKTMLIPFLADYYPNKSSAYPYAYLFSVPDKTMLAKMATHGISIEKLTENYTLEVDKFMIKSLKGSQRLNQGHYTNTIEGEYKTEKHEFLAGSYIVKTNQPLAALIAYLLEPQSGEGFLYWNFLDKYLVPQWGRGFYAYPVYRLNKKMELKSERITSL